MTEKERIIAEALIEKENQETNPEKDLLDAFHAEDDSSYSSHGTTETSNHW